MNLDDPVCQRFPLAIACLVHQVREVLALHGLVCGDLDDLQTVYPVELVGLCGGCTGHPSQFLVHPEVVLQGNGGVGDAFPLDLEAFLGLHSLVQAVGPPSSGLQPAGELVDNHHLAVADHVVLVPLLHHVSIECVFHVLDEMEIFRVIKVRGVGPALHLGNAVLGQRYCPGTVVDGVVRGRVEPGNDSGEILVQLHRLLGGAADDQGSPGLVDQDVVDLVDDGVVQFPLYPPVGGEGHIVAQVIEPEFVIGAIGDVCQVGLLAGYRAKVWRFASLDLRVIYEGRIMLQASYG